MKLETSDKGRDPGRRRPGPGLICGLLCGFLLLALAPRALSDPPPAPSGLAAVFPRSATYDFEPPRPGSYTLPVIKRSPEGRVVDHRGQVRRLGRILEGRYSLVSFVYLLCGDENGCPLALGTLFDIHEASAALPGLKSKVQLVTLSFDPARDTPEALASFAFPVLNDSEAADKLDWHFLTTRSLEELQPLLDSFGQVVDRSGDSDTLNHLLRLFLVDDRGRVRNIYGLGMIDPRLLMTDIETLLIEADLIEAELIEEGATVPAAAPGQ